MWHVKHFFTFFKKNKSVAIGLMQILPSTGKDKSKGKRHKSKLFAKIYLCVSVSW